MSQQVAITLYLKKVDLNDLKLCLTFHYNVTGRSLRQVLFFQWQGIGPSRLAPQQGRCHGVDWDGHVHSIFSRGCFWDWGDCIPRPYSATCEGTPVPTPNYTVHSTLFDLATPLLQRDRSYGDFAGPAGSDGYPGTYGESAVSGTELHSKSKEV